MSAAIQVQLPAAVAQLSESSFQNLRARLPALTAWLNFSPPTPAGVYRLYREPLVTKLAAQAGSPALPGRWTTVLYGPFGGPIGFEKEDLDSGKKRIISGQEVSTSEDHVYIDEDGNITAFSIINITYADVTWEERHWIGATPAIPSQQERTVITGKIGWDGGGRGRNLVPVGSRFTARLYHEVALLVGLAPPGFNYSFGTPTYAWYRHAFSAECVVSGEVVATISTLWSREDTKDWRFGIHRRGGLIQWIYATGPKEPFIVAYTVPDTLETLEPIGIPYTVGDLIDALEIEETAKIEATLPPVQCYMTEEPSYSRIRARMPRIRAELVSLGLNDIAVDLPPVQVRMSDTVWAGLDVILPPADVSMRSEPSFAVHLLYAYTSPVIANMRGYTPVEANFNVTLPPLLGRIEDVSRGRIAGTLPPISARLSHYNRDFGMDILTLGFSHNLSSPLTLITAEGLEVGDTTDIIVIFDLITAEGINLRSLSGLGDLVEILVEEGVYISAAGSDLARREALQYAVNIVTGAPSVYEGFDFNGFVSVDDIAYGWKADGLYRIGESNEADNMAAIRALVDFGISDYGGAQRKRAAAAWLGVRTDGQTYLKVRADNGTEHVYRAVASRDNHKAILAKGVAGRRWSFTLEIEDASFASLDSLEIEIAATARRFGGD